jgi:hypothetical protein
MSSGIIVAVKTKPYLKDYIVFSHGGTEPVKATMANKLYPMLSRYIIRRPIGWKPPEASDDTILFELPYNKIMDARQHCYISPDNFSDISAFFYGLFYTHLIIYMNENCLGEKNKWQFKYGIVKFMDDNNICFDKINYDSIKRIYQRYRKQFEDYDENKFVAKKRKKIFPTSRPVFALIVSLLCPYCVLIFQNIANQ